VKARNLNKYGTGIYTDFKRQTRLINGGYNGLADRVRHWGLAKKKMKCVDTVARSPRGSMRFIKP
jgi:predicted chitinase